MPTYSFNRKSTGETWTEFMSISERDKLTSDPDIEQLISSPAIVDPISIGVTKPPSDFQKYVLGRIKEAVPGNQDIGRRWDIPKEF